MTLPRSDKRQQLKELCQIVMGIRLFNRASGKGGRSITDRGWRQGGSIVMSRGTDLPHVSPRLVPTVLAEAASSLTEVARVNFASLSEKALKTAAALLDVRSWKGMGAVLLRFAHCLPLPTSLKRPPTSDRHCRPGTTTCVSCLSACTLSRCVGEPLSKIRILLHGPPAPPCSS